jgi:hypothetical protein
LVLAHPRIAPYLQDDDRTFGPAVAALFDAVRLPHANAFHVSVLRHEGFAAAASNPPGSPAHLSTGPLWREPRLAQRTFLALQVDVLFVTVGGAEALQLFPYNGTTAPPEPAERPARTVVPRANLLVRVRGDAWRRVSAFPAGAAAGVSVSVEVEQYQVPERHLRQLSKYRTARRRDEDIVDRIE